MSRAALAVWALLVAAPTAHAAQPLGLTDCADVEGVHACSGLVETWDGIPLDTTVVLPRADSARLPLVALIHGFGNSKYEYLDPASEAYTGNAFTWAKRGYAVLAYTARGLWGSCGTPDARAAAPDKCARGYIHLADTRYEVRDAQELIGRLVDDGIADAAHIGVTGDSYGGGQSTAMAALADRVMMPDGSLAPWRTPRGTPLRFAAAAPVIPWTHLVAAIAPNGRENLIEPVGVFKTSVANAILAAAQNAIGPGQPVGEPFIPGRPMGYLAPPGSDPEADVISWVARSDAGEPYTDDTGREVVDTAARYHSSYTIDSSRPPPPLLFASGFTDDLFPVDEVLRFVARTQREHPRVPTSLLLADFGHQRASNKPPDRELLVKTIEVWFDFFLRGRGPAPPRRSVTAMTQTCPRDQPSGGPFTARRFAQLGRGRVASDPSTETQTISSAGGDPSVATAIDPATGGGDGCVEVSAARAPGTAVYSLPVVKDAFTLLGAPHVSARLTVTGTDDPTVTQVAARLWDVAPDGSSQRLVARGSYRPTGDQSDQWDLHPAAWRFEPGHTPKLELLGTDPPYSRPSNASFEIAIDDLQLVLPVHRPACTSRRRFTIRVPRHLRAPRVFVAGKRVAVRRHRAVIDLRGRSRGTVRVRITGRTASGRRTTTIRRFRTCTPKPAPNR